MKKTTLLTLTPFHPKEKANSTFIHSENEKMKKNEHKLGLEVKDVKYIVVRTEAEIKIFADFIQTNLRNVFKNEDERNVLVSKLISAEQIKEDM